MRRSKSEALPAPSPCLPLPTPGTKRPCEPRGASLKKDEHPQGAHGQLLRKERLRPKRRPAERHSGHSTMRTARCGAHQPRHKSTKAEQGRRNAGSRRQRHGIRQKRKRPPQGAFSGWSSYVGKRPCMRPSKAPCAPKKEGAAPHRLSDRAVNKSGKRRTPQKSKRAHL